MAYYRSLNDYPYLVAELRAEYQAIGLAMPAYVEELAESRARHVGWDGPNHIVAGTRATFAWMNGGNDTIIGGPGDDVISATATRTTSTVPQATTF